MSSKAKPLPHKVTVTVIVDSPNVSDIEFGEMLLDPDAKAPRTEVEQVIRRTWGAENGSAHYTVWDRQSDPSGKNPTRLVSGSIKLGSPA